MCSTLFNSQLLLYLSLLAIFFGCKPSEKVGLDEKAQPRSYDSHYPTRNVDKQLKSMMRSVYRLSSTTYYRTYHFRLSDSVTTETLPFIRKANLAYRIDQDDISKASTAVVVYKDEKKVGLLTCAHSVTSPDTIINYAKSKTRKQFIVSFSIKQYQKEFIYGEQNLQPFEIIIKDDKRDLALISSPYQALSWDNAIPLTYRGGDMNRLNWGSFVFVIGYPKGNLMVSRGIASIFDKKDNFIIDTPFNEGYSGGIVMALRNGVPNFEWIGIANTSSATSELILKPSAKYDYNTEENVPYEGDIFVAQRKSIDYGVTKVASISSIREFLQKSRQTLINVDMDYTENWSNNLINFKTRLGR